MYDGHGGNELELLSVYILLVHFFLLIWNSLVILLSGVGKVVAKFCAKYLHQQVLSNEAYGAGDFETSLQGAFFRYCLFL